MGAALIVCIAAWSFGTARFARFATPPNADGWLRAYLITAGILVTAAVWRKPTKASLALLLCAWLTLAAVPDPNGDAIPPAGTVLPLPNGTTITANEVTCHDTLAGTSGCTRTITLPATPETDLGHHLERKGWQVTWIGTLPQIQCRPSHRLLDPYELCATIATGTDRTTRIQLYYSNPNDPIY